jgi:hypothetical protein
VPSSGFKSCPVPLGLEQFPLSLGDDLGGAVDHPHGGLIAFEIPPGCAASSRLDQGVTPSLPGGGSNVASTTERAYPN